ncbi:MAG TPA: hypothetical protein VK005_03255, partial [Acholeplasma sp.]|nr:hypothetical protein [Acholeplasma sp.]
MFISRCYNENSNAKSKGDIDIMFNRKELLLNQLEMISEPSMVDNYKTNDLYYEKFIKNNVSKLYKFRTVNSDNLDALKDDYLYLKLAKGFSDQSDTTLSFKFNEQQRKEVEKVLKEFLPETLLDELKKHSKIITNIQNNIDDEKILKFLSSLDFSDDSEDQNKLKMFLINEGYEESDVDKTLKFVSEKRKEFEHSDKMKKLVDDVEKRFIQMNERLRETYY